MQTRSFRFGTIILITIIGTLILISGILYQEKIYYKELNRELIIKNDSLISVTIELSNALKSKVANRDASLDYKSQSKK
jgi:hypothetical protein